jgi:hypothetical protein
MYGCNISPPPTDLSGCSEVHELQGFHGRNGERVFKQLETRKTLFNTNMSIKLLILDFRC